MNRAETLEQLTRLCNLNREGVAPPAIEATGFAELDAVLPNSGWQSGTIVELMPEETGIGELRLLMPALAQMTQKDRHIALISPPYIPFAPALTNHGVRLDRLLIIRAEKNVDTLWAMEQTLRCKSFAAAVGWPESIRDRDVRRLQLAAEAGRSTGFIYRTIAAARAASPAAVRMRLQVSPQGLLIDVLKSRGARAGFSITVAARSSAEPAASARPAGEGQNEDQSERGYAANSSLANPAATADPIPILFGQLPLASGQ